MKVGTADSPNTGMKIFLMVRMTYKISSNTKAHNGVTEFSRAVSCPQSWQHHTSLCMSQLLQETGRGRRAIPANEHTQANHAVFIFCDGETEAWKRHFFARINFLPQIKPRQYPSHQLLHYQVSLATLQCHPLFTPCSQSYKTHSSKRKLIFQCS